MYQQLRSQVLVQIADLDAETISRVAKALDTVSGRFTVTANETSLTVRSGGLPDCAKYYLVNRKIEGLSDGTLRQYKLRLEQFFEACNKPLQDIRANDIRGYLFNYQREHDTSNRTLDGIRTALCVFFSWAAAEEYITADPTANIRKIKYEKTHKSALTQMELEIFRHRCKTLREKAIVEFLFSTGCRVSEMTNAKLSDIDWQRNELTVLGKGNKHRVVYLNAKAVVSLKDYLESRDDNTDAIFVHMSKPHLPMSPKAVQDEISRIKDRCPEIKKPVTPHVFRHTACTIALASGMDVTAVSRMLGHESLDTTMIYVDISQQTVQSAHKKYVI